MACLHAAAKAAEAAAPEATEAATAAPRGIAGTATHGYEPTREAAMAAFARAGGGRRDGYDIDISLMNLRHHWNAKFSM